ncbi:MAG: hydantoinase/oxoprolinase family protein [Planctomycetota bacterium]
MTTVAAESRYRFSFDIGGTFTDLVLYDESTGHMEVRKELTNAANPGEPIIKGLRALLDARKATPAQVLDVVCGATTLVTNLVIERKGLPTALVTTRGFRDILEIRREGRYDLYDLTARYPAPLVPRSLRFEVDERIAADGTVVEALAEDQARRIVSSIRDLGIRSLAICFLHSYRNDAHERKMEALIRDLAPDVMVSCSSEVSPEIREFERFSSTVLNAYVKPFIGNYFRSLEEEMKRIGLPARLHIMQSNGGILDTQEAERVPIRLLESGPAAGAIAAAKFGDLMSKPDLISFDMGGTTAKTCLVMGAKPGITYEFDTARVDRFKKGSGFPVRMPIVDLIEIGAGGGSIARVDTTGLLKVGPDSASSNPGPACYGIGGREPTVTDANLVLGYLSPHTFNAGRMQLDRKLAERAIEERIGRQLGISVEEAASGIFRIVNENMANAAKIHVAEKGKDPRNFSFVAFGGAGPIHAREIARLLGVGTLVVPLSAGVFSALGLLLAPLSIDLTRTRFEGLEAVNWSAVKTQYDALQERAKEVISAAGGDVGRIEVNRAVDVRYVGQGHELTVRLDGNLCSNSSERLRDRFYLDYTELFGRAIMDVPLEVLNLRLTASCPLGEFDLRTATAPSRERGAVQRGTRKIYISETAQFEEAPVFDHVHLPYGYEAVGPAVIEQRESTVIVGPGDRVSVDKLRNLVIQLSGRGKENTHAH